MGSAPAAREAGPEAEGARCNGYELMTARKWLVAAIISATFASLLFAKDVIPETAREYLLAPCAPHLLVALLLLEVAAHIVVLYLPEWTIPPALWILALAL